MPTASKQVRVQRAPGTRARAPGRPEAGPVSPPAPAARRPFSPGLRFPRSGPTLGLEAAAAALTENGHSVFLGFKGRGVWGAGG